MNKEIKRKIYAIALAGIIIATPKTRGYAEEIDNSPIDIDKAISELVPGYEEINSNTNTSNNSGNNSYNDTVNSNNQICYHLYEENPDEIINFVSPTCEYPGIYDAVYHCVKCGYSKIEREYMNSFGHDLGEAHIENETDNGYDIVRKCQNPNCDYAEVEKVEYIGAETTNQIDNINKNTNKQNNNSNAKVALISLGVLGVSAHFLFEKMDKLNDQKNTKKKGKYLHK